MKKHTLNPGWFETLKLNILIPPIENDLVPVGIFIGIYDGDTELKEIY